MHHIAYRTDLLRDIEVSVNGGHMLYRWVIRVLSTYQFKEHCILLISSL